MSKKCKIDKCSNNHSGEIIKEKEVEDILEVFKCQSCGSYIWIYLIYNHRKFKCNECGGLLAPLPSLKESIKNYRKNYYSSTEGGMIGDKKA